MSEKGRYALNLYREGRKKAEVARLLGLSATRTSQLIAREERRERQGKSNSGLEGLSSKLAGAVEAAGFTSKASVAEGLRSGEIGLRYDGSGKIPYIGKHGVTQLALWSGVETPQVQEINKAILLLRQHGYEVIEP